MELVERAREPGGATAPAVVVFLIVTLKEDGRAVGRERFVRGMEAGNPPRRLEHGNGLSGDTPDGNLNHRNALVQILEDKPVLAGAGASMDAETSGPETGIVPE
jgi:hypothetical protein